MQKSCEDISEMLVDYVDGELPPDKSSEVAEHLPECERCRKTVEALQRSLELAGVIWKDGLEEAKGIQVPVPVKARRVRWSRYAAVAAALMLVVSSAIVWRVVVSSKEKEPTVAEIEREISESASAAQLLAVTDLLAQYRDAGAIAQRQYQYIVERYPGTAAAAEAKLRIH